MDALMEQERVPVGLTVEQIRERRRRQRDERHASDIARKNIFVSIYDPGWKNCSFDGPCDPFICSYRNDGCCRLDNACPFLHHQKYRKQLPIKHRALFDDFLANQILVSSESKQTVYNYGAIFSVVAIILFFGLVIQHNF